MERDRQNPTRWANKLLIATEEEAAAGVRDDVAMTPWTTQIAMGSTGSTGSGSTFPGSPSFGLWCGALTPTGCKICFDAPEATEVSVVVSASASLTSPVFTGSPVTPTPTPAVDIFTGAERDFYPASFTVTGLAANTTYYYAPVFSGVTQTAIVQRFKTLPAAGSATGFRFVFGSCSFPPIYRNPHWQAHWQDRVFRSIALENPLFLLHLGDLDYPDVDQDDIRVQRSRNARMVRYYNDDFAEMCRTVPIVYTYDDHDAGAGDGKLNDVYVSKDTHEAIVRNTRAVIRETTPIYPTVQDALGGFPIGHNLISQVFDVGQCRFFVPDCRAHRRTNIAVPTALGRNLGDGDYWDQLGWIQGALAAASADGIKGVMLGSSMTWTGGIYSGWTDAFPAERQVLCDAIQAMTIPTTVLVGDAHESAADDGTNTGFSADGYARFPQLLGSPLSQFGVLAGSGPYSWNGLQKRFQGNAMQYCVVDVSYDGNGDMQWTATFKGAPIDPVTFAATTLGSVTSTDATRVVSVPSKAPYYAQADTPYALPVSKTWFGGCSVNYAITAGTAGTVTFPPNDSREYITLPGKADTLTTVVTLSNPLKCSLGNSVITVTFANADPDVLNYANACVVSPDATRLGHLTTMVAALKAGAVWDDFVGLWVLAAHTQQAATVNMKDPNRFNLLERNAPSFVVDRGFASDGETSYLDTRFTPAAVGATLFPQDNNAMGGWCITDAVGAAAGSCIIGVQNTLINPRSPANQVRFRNSANVTDVATATSSLGLWIVRRTTSTSFILDHDNATLATKTRDSQPHITGNVLICALGGIGGVSQWDARRTAVGFVCKTGLSDAKRTVIYNALHTYLVAVGAV